jgi:CheY-like chemotaxis protein
VRASRRPVRLHGMVQKLLADLGLDRPVTVEVAADDTVLADPEHLRQILAVLLGNATKHTPPGTAVTVRLEQTPGASTVIVEDEGPGVPVDRREEIFAPFQRWRPPEDQPGLGLGLFVVAGLVRAHSGNAWVEERAGGGASFRVAFPTDTSAAASWSTPTATVTLDLRDPDDAPTWGGRPRILVVDDDQAVRDTVRVVLELEGFDVDTTGSGLDAIELAARRHPQVVVLDVLLPDVDGWAVAERLLSDDHAEEIAVVFCTAAAGAASRERARRLGAAGLIGKPFNPERLVRLVVGLVRSQIAAVGGYPERRGEPGSTD